MHILKHPLQQLLNIFLFALFFLTFTYKTQANSLYWGAYISGLTYGLNANPPWDTTAWDTFEAHTGKKISIFHWGLPWYNSVGWPQGYYPFVPSLLDTVRSRGAIPFLDWGSWDLGSTSVTSQPNFSLSTIISGNHDTYITQWATAAKNWGHPFFLRWNWEMNGNWFPWSEEINGNSSGQFVQAWHHVHDIFTQVGANNVTWVWCPNTINPNSIPLAGLYPGNNYVDWTCIDGYNWSTVKSTSWLSFYQVFKPTYDQLLTLAPSKPIIIGETASIEQGGSKAAWITDMLSTQLPNNFPQIKGLLWFNWNTDNADWVIETSSLSQSAFAQGITNSLYAANDFSTISTNPIMPLSPLPTPVFTLTDFKYVFSHYLDTSDSLYYQDSKLNLMDAVYVISKL